MRLFRFLISLAISCLVWASLLGFSVSSIAYIAGILIFTLLVGEYILPILLHRSDERFDFAARVDKTLQEITDSMNDTAPSHVRVIVLDDDEPVMTWTGFRTVYVTRGCYNLPYVQFKCAVQEAYRQRTGLRSFVLLLATIGNPAFVLSRIFCLIGRFFFRFIGMLIGAILGHRNPVISGSIGSRVGDGLFRFFCAVFIFFSHLAVYLHWISFVWADLENDSILCSYGMSVPLRELIKAKRRDSLSGIIYREYCCTLRAPSALRLGRISKGSSVNHSGAAHSHTSGNNQRHDNLQTPPGSGINIPDEMITQGLERPTQQTSGKTIRFTPVTGNGAPSSSANQSSGTHKIKFVPLNNDTDKN